MAKRKQHVSEEQTRKAEVALTEMAKKPKFLTLQQTIEKIRPKITAVIEQGYSYQDVVEVLKSLDIQISIVTLRQYLKVDAGANGQKKGSPAQPMPESPTPDVMPPATGDAAGAFDVDAAIDAITSVERMTRIEVETTGSNNSVKQP